MPNENNKKNKRIVSELDVFLVSKLGIFNSIKGKKIKFNPQPDANKTEPDPKENTFEENIEIEKKIDKLPEKRVAVSKIDETESPFKEKESSSFKEVMEIREPQTKRPEIPHFKTEIELKNVFGEFNQKNNFFEVEIPIDTQNKDVNNQENNDDFVKWILDGQEKSSENMAKGIGQIRVREKSKQYAQTNEKSKNNNCIKTKIELEKTKKEIEERKKALDEAIQKEKQKESELKRKTEEKRKIEKLKKLELKKKLKEKKLKEKEELKAKREKEKELKKLEREKIKEGKIKKAEKEKIEKQKELERIKKEKEEKLKNKEAGKKDKEYKEKREVTLIDKEKIESNKYEDEVIFLDNDIKKLLPIIDELLENLPGEVINQFAQSQDFLLYEKVMNKYMKK